MYNNKKGLGFPIIEFTDGRTLNPEDDYAFEDALKEPQFIKKY